MAQHERQDLSAPGSRLTASPASTRDAPRLAPLLPRRAPVPAWVHLLDCGSAPRLGHNCSYCLGIHLGRSCSTCLWSPPRPHRLLTNMIPDGPSPATHA